MMGLLAGLTRVYYHHNSQVKKPDFFQLISLFLRFVIHQKTACNL